MPNAHKVETGKTRGGWRPEKEKGKLAEIDQQVAGEEGIRRGSDQEGRKKKRKRATQGEEVKQFSSFAMGSFGACKRRVVVMSRRGRGIIEDRKEKLAVFENRENLKRRRSQKGGGGGKGGAGCFRHLLRGKRSYSSPSGTTPKRKRGEGRLFSLMIVDRTKRKGKEKKKPPSAFRNEEMEGESEKREGKSLLPICNGEGKGESPACVRGSALTKKGEEEGKRGKCARVGGKGGEGKGWAERLGRWGRGGEKEGGI